MNSHYVHGLRDVMRFNKMPDGIPLDKETMRMARYGAMRRGLRYLLEYVLIFARSGCTTAQALEAAHHLTRPELLKEPALGRQEMERLADVHAADGMGEFYAFASDIYHYGERGDAGELARFLWDTPATKISIALELISLLSVESNTTMHRTLIEIDQALREALTMVSMDPAPAEAEGESALVAAGVDEDDDWMADWMKDPDEGDRS